MNKSTHTLSIRRLPRHHYSAATTSPTFEDLYEATIVSPTGEKLHTFYYLARPGETSALQAKLNQLGYSTPKELLPKPLAPSYELHQK